MKLIVNRIQEKNKKTGAFVFALSCKLEVSEEEVELIKNYGKENAVFEQGYVALLAASESGRTQCQFDNAWLWLIGP